MNRSSDTSNYVRRLKNVASSERPTYLRALPVADRGTILLTTPKSVQKDVLSILHTEEIISMLHFLDPDDSAGLLQYLSPGRRKKVVEALSDDLRTKVQFLLKFHPDTAAGMMSLDYVQVSPDDLFGSVASAIRSHEKHTGRFPTLLAVKEGKLKGELPGHALVLGEKQDVITKSLKSVPSIAYTASPQEVEQLFRDRAHSKIVVLDEDGSIIGVIFADDVLKVIDRRQQKELYDFAGVQEEEDVTDSALVKVGYRYKWLIINLGTAFLAASVVGLFDDVISRYVLLAVYMPIVAGMGGNAGTQTMAVTVRGLALKKIDLSKGWTLLRSEAIAGGINGLINGIIVAFIAVVFNHSPKLGIVLGVAMVVNLIIAGIFGALIPLLMQKFGKDPATSATIFITTATDVFGFLVFLGLAQVLL